MAVLSNGPGRTGSAGQGWRMPPAVERPQRIRHAEVQVEAAPHGRGTRFVGLVRLAGAAASLALMVGVGVWGYKLLVRDVTGIPVVRAMEGPMRVAPENPGGEVADYTGLAVNAIAAMGEAAPPEDVLTLAPAAEGLAPEDLEVAAAPVTEERVPLSAEEVLAFADQVAAGVEPLAPLAEEETVAAPADEGTAAASGVISAEIPGVVVSLRPLARPGGVLARVEMVSADTTAPAPEVLGTPLPAGTTLVQFGAYDSPALAAEEWERLRDRFGNFLDGHERVIQGAASGGREFYRLRAIGFADMGEARRLCTALIAEGVDCIPTIEG